MSDVEITKRGEISLDVSQRALVDESKLRSDDYSMAERGSSIQQRRTRSSAATRLSQSIFTVEKEGEDQVPERDVTRSDVEATLLWSGKWMRYVFYILYGVHGFRYDSTLGVGDGVLVDPRITRFGGIIVVLRVLIVSFFGIKMEFMDGSDANAYSIVQFMFMLVLYALTTAIYYFYGSRCGISLAKSGILRRLEEEVLTNVRSLPSVRWYLRCIGIMHCATLTLGVIFACTLAVIDLVLLARRGDAVRVNEILIDVLLLLPSDLGFYVLPFCINFHQSCVYAWLAITRMAVTRDLITAEREKLQHGEEADVALIKRAIYDHINDVEVLNRELKVMNIARIAVVLCKLAATIVFYEDVLGIYAWLVFADMAIPFICAWLSLVVAGGSNHAFYSELLTPFMMDDKVDERSELGSFLMRAHRANGIMGHKVMYVYLTQKEVILIGSLTIFLVHSVLSLKKSLE